MQELISLHPRRGCRLDQFVTVMMLMQTCLENRRAISICRRGLTSLLLRREWLWAEVDTLLIYHQNQWPKRVRALSIYRLVCYYEDNIRNMISFLYEFKNRNIISFHWEHNSSKRAFSSATIISKV